MTTEVKKMSPPSKYGLRVHGDTWRNQQVQAIEWFERDNWFETLEDSNVSWDIDRDALLVGTDHDYGSVNIKDQKRIKLLEAPPGTGKTALILGLAKRHPELKFLILCATKIEQEQYRDNLVDGRGASFLYGQNNFHCAEENEEIGDEKRCEVNCNKTHVDTAWCQSHDKRDCEAYSSGSCYYYMQFQGIKSQSIIITNYQFGLLTLNYNPKLLGQVDVIVCDEGHILDQMLESFIGIELTDVMCEKRLNINLPRYETVQQYKQWWMENEIQVEEFLEEAHFDVRDKALAQRAFKSISRLSSITDDWIVEHLSDESKVTILPIWVKEEARQVLLEKSNKLIIMSGTIPSESMLAKKCGIFKDEFDFLRLPYTFPVENRPIIVAKDAVKMGKNDIDLSLPELVECIDDWIDQYDDKKILIHTFSYKVSQYICEHSFWSNDMLTHDSRNRNLVLSAFKATINRPTILVSPSMDNAVNLPGDECELCIVAKLPYPYLGSKIMQKRIRQDQRYYGHETLMSLIQMAFRGVRSETDICPTVIVDAGARKFLKQVKRMIPQEISEAISYE